MLKALLKTNMKTNKIVTLTVMLMLCFIGASADGVKSLRLSEAAIGDSAGTGAWIEIQNTSWGTQNLGGYYITNDPAVFNTELTAPQRIAKMHLIPTGNPITKITPQNCILLYADGHDNLGLQHMNFTLHPGDIIAIYSGNGIDLVDSVTIPADITATQSFAYNSKDNVWTVCDKPTPTLANDYETAKKNNKIAEFKEKDPHGFAMAIMAMGVVFGCLALLYIFFTIFGKVANLFSEKKFKLIKISTKAKASKNNEETVAAIMAVTEATSGTGNENLDVALIALSLQAEMAHDKESGVITIKPTKSAWADKGDQIEAGMLEI